MKIGILSYHAASNFGAQLQVLSTVSYLKKNGYTPIVINWYPEDLEKLYKKLVPSIQMNIHAEFVSKYLPVTKLCRTEVDVISVVKEEKITGLIIGSDAILNYQSFLSRIRLCKTGLKLEHRFSSRTYPNPFWGEGIDSSISKVMLSASSQNCPYNQVPSHIKQKMGISLKGFSFISVRDDWTKKMVGVLTNGKITPEITPDPVFGFNSNDVPIPSKNEIIDKYNLPDKYVLLSFKKDGSGIVSKKWLETFEKLAGQNGIACVAMCIQGGIRFDNNLRYKIDIPLCPLDWYTLIKYSCGYVGHNMHPIVVSIHNVVPFFSFDNYGIVKCKYSVNSESSKIFHILKEANMLKYRCTAAGRFSYKEPSPEMVFDRILNFERSVCDEFSNKYLSKYLKTMKSVEAVFVSSLL
jgi:hypothetical protein